MPTRGKATGKNIIYSDILSQNNLFISASSACILASILIVQCHGRKLNKVDSAVEVTHTVGGEQRLGGQKWSTKVVVVINDGCPTNVTTPEGFMEHCVAVWKNSRESRDKKLQTIKDDGCGIFPAFRESSARLDYKVREEVNLPAYSAINNIQKSLLLWILIALVLGVNRLPTSLHFGESYPFCKTTDGFRQVQWRSMVMASNNSSETPT